MKRVLRCVIVFVAVLGVAATASAGTINFHPNGLGGTVVKTMDGRLTGSNLAIAWLATDELAVPINWGSLYFDWGGADPSLVISGTIPDKAAGPLLIGDVYKGMWYGTDAVVSLWEGRLNYQLAQALGINSTAVEFVATLWFAGGAPTLAGQYFTNYYDVASVPEPGSMLLFGSGLLGVAAVVRRRLRR